MTPADRRAEPIVVFGPWSERYDFGAQHPLTPRRFGPGIDLLRHTGAGRFLEPEPIGDDALRRLHDERYIEVVRAFSVDPDGPPRMGIGPGDCPAFDGMHEASAAVAGGSLAAMTAILSGTTEHAFHPGGGLHHAMAGRASGFCIYDDVALGVAAARDAGHRVLYVDLDVHHGDGVQALFWDDPEVMTVSIHESGEYLFPGTGSVPESGGPAAPGAAVNLPLAPFSGDDSWLPIVESVVPALAAAYQPTMLVTQHGCDSHLNDPLAHLRLTTRAYDRATRLLDGLAHEHCEGRWLATGGGGYDVHRVVPRSWALVWLAQAHRAVPPAVPLEWRERWQTAAADFDQAGLPEAYLDPVDLLEPDPVRLVEMNRASAERSRRQSLRLLAGDRAPGRGRAGAGW